MRKLKFRAWDNKKGKWLFGYEHPNLGGFSLIGEVVLFGQLSEPSLQDWDHIDIDQSTGLVDKNGKEIYEGDIVMCRSIYHGVPVNFRFSAAIVYNQHIASFQISYKNQGGGFSSDEIYFKYEIEHIGNIHEHPELLS